MAMLITRCLGVLTLLLASLACNSPQVTEDPQSSPRVKPLGDIVLRLSDYPDGFEVVDTPASIDMTEPFSDAPSCRTIGIPHDRVLEGLIQGDSVGEGSPEDPPATGAGTAAMRVKDDRDLRDLLNEFESARGKNCLRDELNVDGTLRLRTQAAGSARTMTATQGSDSEGFGFVLVVRGTTLALGLVATVGTRLDARLLRSIASQLVERVG